MKIFLFLLFVFFSTLNAEENSLRVVNNIGQSLSDLIPINEKIVSSRLYNNSNWSKLDSNQTYCFGIDK